MGGSWGSAPPEQIQGEGGGDGRNGRESDGQMLDKQE